MSETTEIVLAEGARRISVEDLQQIKRELLAVLRSKNPEDYGHLIPELEQHSAAMILPDGQMAIGSWNLRVEQGQAVLERQQMPRAPLMRFYEAELAFDKGQWRVVDVTIKKVRGR